MKLTCGLWGLVWIVLIEPLFMAVSKPMLTEFDIHHRLESCGIGKLFRTCEKGENAES